MEQQFSFEKLAAWQEDRGLVKDIYALLAKFPHEERYALCDQIRRAVVSVPSNIAEGSGRMSKNEQRHFYEIAYGSLMETYCQLILAVDLGYLNEVEIAAIKQRIWHAAKVLSALRNSIKE